MMWPGPPEGFPGDTTIVCLECEDRSSRDRIPADWDEIRGAWEEGIRIIYSRGVSRIIGSGERMKKIECPKCTRVYDKSGFNPEFDMQDMLTLEGDVLIITWDRDRTFSHLRRKDLFNERGQLALDPVTLQNLKKEWVFIGGDVRRIGFMVDAMKDGLVAAESIERYLKGIISVKTEKRILSLRTYPGGGFTRRSLKCFGSPRKKNALSALRAGIHPSRGY